MANTDKMLDELDQFMRTNENWKDLNICEVTDGMLNLVWAYNKVSIKDTAQAETHFLAHVAATVGADSCSDVGVTRH